MSKIKAGTTTTTAYQVEADTTGTLVLQTGSTPTTAVTIDASQNVSVGTTSPSAWSGAKGFQVERASVFGVTSLGGFASNAYLADSGANYRYIATGTAALYLQNAAGDHRWNIAASGTAGNVATFTQAMTLDSSGNLLVGFTGNNVPSSTNSIQMFNGNLGTVTRQTKPFVSGAYSVSAGLPQWFSNWASSANWGIGPHSGNNDSIVRIGVATTDANGAYWTGAYAAIYAGAYTNASDYRIKENVVDVENGVLEKVLALRVVNYNIIGIPDEDGDLPQYKEEIGFIAHEIQEHFPVVVSGEKDAVDGNGDALHQGVDYAKMSAVLTKAIQEQQALITTLKAELDAVKAQLQGAA